MTIVEIEMLGRKTEKVFKNHEIALHFLRKKGYVFDEINQYYWKLDIMFGWMTKAKIVEQSSQE